MGHFIELAKTILRQEQKPMKVTEIIEKARELGYLDFSGGKTPHQTIKARISEDIKKNKENSSFKRVSRGVFALRDYDAKEYDAIPHIKKISAKEDVLVIKTSKLSEIGLFNGIKSAGYQKYLDLLLDKNSTFFIPRIEAEKDISHKQILSYILVVKGNKILRFVRGVYTNAHSMLRGSLCIGFGGHVQNSDINLFEQLYGDNGYLNSVKRELLEELKIPETSITNRSLSIIGVLNDDSSDVGKSHIAIIHKLTLNKLKIRDARLLKGEKSINQLTFLPIDELGNDFEKYEYWSKLCIKEYYQDYIEQTCKIHRVKNYSLAKHPKVIIIVGAIGSGKTEAAKILEENFNYKFVSSGSVLQNLMESKPINAIGRKKFQDLAYQFITKQGGFETLASKLIDLIRSNNTCNYVIDGIRNMRTYELIKTELGLDCTLIFVESTPDNCFKFYTNREKQHGLDANVFYDYLNHPVERDIKVILGKANLVVYNHGTLSSFKSQIKRFLKSELHE